jgi:CRISPR-associated endoribonuclease Cas6
LRIKLVLEKEGKDLTLPIHYNQIIQGMLYRSLSRLLAKFLHDVGFFHNNRPFKLFTFSKIFAEKFNIHNSIAYFKPPITIYISSAIEEVSKSFAETVLQREKIILNRQPLTLKSIEIMPKPKFNQINKIRTLSPITVYKTIEKEDGKKFTQYIFPEDPNFATLIKENIKKKYSIIKGIELGDFEFEIKPINYKVKPLKYKDYIIKAVDGKFEIKTDPEILEAVYDAGLGAKNSQGFGMIEIMSEN